MNANTKKNKCSFLIEMGRNMDLRLYNQDSLLFLKRIILIQLKPDVYFMIRNILIPSLFTLHVLKLRLHMVGASSMCFD